MLDRLAEVLWEEDPEESFLRLLLDRGIRKLGELTSTKEEG